MNKKDVLKIKAILTKIKNKDGHVEEAIAVCDKQLATFKEAGRGLKEHYELEESRW